MATKEKIKKDMETGKKEDTIYSEEGMEELTESDEISDLEEGFMEGYESGLRSGTKCPVCGEILEDDFVEREYNDEIYRFCSDEHAEKWIERKARKKLASKI